MELADELFLFDFEDEIDVVVGDRGLVDVDGTIFTPAGRLAGLGDELETGDLEGERNELCELGNVAVFLMEHEHDLLGDVFGDLPPITRCREGENPFT